jgi:hypothetical protein
MQKIRAYSASRRAIQAKATMRLYRRYVPRLARLRWSWCVSDARRSCEREPGLLRRLVRQSGAHTQRLPLLARYATALMSRRNFETFADEYRHASNARLRMAFPMSLNIFLVFARLTYE